ncbi:MAG: 50S ribosomal protein L35 [Candidatus Omnitrophota bacterium]|jgi:large subunit ribosomal protein L35|nr:50S ribosomal protein L35 [Candidatus Omnitrophota bacterium]
MPKLKTSKSVKKRIRISKRGKIKHFKTGKRHLLGGKSSKRKRQLGKPGYVSHADASAIRLLLPYGA